VAKNVSQSDIAPKTLTTEKKKPVLQIHPNQLQGINSLRTQCNLPNAEDVEASNNRVLALNWLYRLSGREQPNHPEHGTYTGLWQDFLNLYNGEKS
jgi:hypothetical protein